MPRYARAHGLWGGPLPEAIGALTNLETRIVRCGRVHSNVQRVSLNNAMWAKGNTDALPSYVSTSSYVFAQDPENFTRTLCLLPAALTEQFAVQLVGCQGRAVTPEGGIAQP